MRHLYILTAVGAVALSCSARKSGVAYEPAAVQSADARTSAVGVYRRLENWVQLGELDSLVGLFAESASYRDRTFDFEVRGRGAIREAFSATIRGFGDRRMTVRRIIASGDTVVMEWVLTGRLVGSMLGAPADSLPIELEGISVGLVTDGRIVDHTDYLDRASLETRLRLRSRR